MAMNRILMGVAASAAMLAPTAAMAGSARSAGALPAVQSAAQVPQSGVRNSDHLKHKSNAIGNPGIGYGLAALVAAGVVGAVVLVASDDDPDYQSPDSPG